MRAVVVYESMFGQTRRVAEAVGWGLQALGDVAVVPAARAGAALGVPADVVVVGSPTHVRSLPRPKSRASAAEMAAKPDSKVVLEAEATGAGVREWLASLPAGKKEARAAAFDTKMQMPALMTGRASKRIHREMRRHGYSMLCPAESFLVGSSGRLVDGEEDRARRWGESLAASMMPGTGRGSPGAGPLTTPGAGR